MSYDPCPHGHEPSVCEQCRTVILDAALGHRAAGSRVEPPTTPIGGPRNIAPARFGSNRHERRRAARLGRRG